MTASSISRILSGAGFNRSKLVPGRIVARRSEGYSVRAAGNNKDGNLVVVVEHEFDRYCVDQRKDGDAVEQDRSGWLTRYKSVLEARGFTVRLVKGEYVSQLAVTA